MGLLGFLTGSGAYNKNIRDLKSAKDEARSMYSKQMNEDYSQSAAAQSALSNARKVLEERYNQTAGAAAVGGATDESVALQKQANNQTMAQTASSIAAQGTANRNAGMQGFLNATQQYNNAIIGQRQARAQAETAAAEGIINNMMLGGSGIWQASIEANAKK